METTVRVLPDADGVRVIVCAGDFDLDSVAPLRSAADEAVTAPHLRRIVVDVSGLTFADSSVLNQLMRLLRTGRLVLAGPVPLQLARLLDVTGMAPLFTVAKDPEGARAL
ncbi:STAS domain-containing protein [Streptomyces sp. NPDC029003]|uniref:STAS domain-containing protein n=1 Tax=Streptomyces sp. NPDC029003 TaxID=3155125 RepID=UPI0033C1E61F